MQPNRMCLVYWATGVQPVFLQGALERARSRQPQTGVRGSERPAVRRQFAPAASGLVVSGDADGSGRLFRFRLTRADRQFLQSLGISAR